MRDPAGSIAAGAAATIITGNQFQGDGNPGNQLQDGSALLFQKAGSPGWTPVSMQFLTAEGNNKYYSAQIPAASLNTGDVIQYYCRVAYDDHDTTFVCAPAGISTAVADESAAQANPFQFTVEDPAAKGRWSATFALPNVAIHSHVLPNGKVLLWGRRDNPGDSVDLHRCTPFVWDPQNATSIPTAPLDVNLFCSGHAFLPDGRLLVVGGHWQDGDGISQASLFDWHTSAWAAAPPMTDPAGNELRRWYPTALSLSDGSVLVLAGSYKQGADTIQVDLLQIWRNGAWGVIPRGDGTPLTYTGLPLYPLLHTISSGSAFMSGPNGRTLRLKTSAPGEWMETANRDATNRDYASSVMFRPGEIVYIGGGNDPGAKVPTAQAETINLSSPTPAWGPAGTMSFPRRQHNATILPDGTVLVTGGTRGGGGPNPGFNDLTVGQPVHFAELWNPDSKTFALLSAETVDRCYHSTAVLLPDATVLSAGGGEYYPEGASTGIVNDPADSHRDGQIFSPPYLFKGARPTITGAPDAADYGQQFDVATPDAASVKKVSWISLSSATHAANINQRIHFLDCQAGAGKLTITSPASPGVCPPGYYMLFLLNNTGVPSVAKIMQLKPIAAPAAGLPMLGSHLQVQRRAAVISHPPPTPPVVIGLSGTCPYGIGACWGGAYEALGHLEGVAFVAPVPDTVASTARVFLKDRALPNLDAWREQFHRIANGSYSLRGIEMTLEGTVEERNNVLLLSEVQLAPLDAASKVQRQPLTEREADAHQRLASVGARRITVTGALEQTGTQYRLRVREFQPV